MNKFSALLIIFCFAFSSCSSDTSDIEETPEIANVEAELIMFNYENNMEENTFVMEFKVKFINKSSFRVNGEGKVNYKSTNPMDTFTYSWFGTECKSMGAGESCIVSYYQLSDLDHPDVYGPDGPYEYEFHSAEYILAEE